MQLKNCQTGLGGRNKQLKAVGATPWASFTAINKCILILPTGSETAQDNLNQYNSLQKQGVPIVAPPSACLPFLLFTLSQL